MMKGTPAGAASPGPPAAWHQHEVEWTRIAATASTMCLLFSLWPQIDLEVSRWFLLADGGFLGNRMATVWLIYQGVPWVGRSAGLVALGVLLLGAGRRPRVGVRWRRRCLALGLTMLVGVGLLVNGGLKEHWGRPRPAAVLSAGATAPFEPALRPSEQCRHNCSFVSGHAATGFALMSLGMFGAPATRRRWWTIGMIAGLCIGAGRVAQGGHFVSDVLFAGVVIWACHAALRHAWLLRRARRRRAAAD